MGNKEKPILRFAPSPTGFLHVGSARTALFNYLYAKQNGGELILRIEDTDKERSKPEFEKNIIDGLKWLGISFNQTFKQSERGEIYKKYLNQMIEDGTAYISKETEGKSSEVIRFKNPNKKIKFNDLIRGDIEFDTTELGDFVIAKDLDTPLYHLAVVVDDFDMGVTHILRGDDGISNTPRQILLQEALNAPRPQYGHIPLILASDRSKLSKRHGAVSITEYENQGYLSEAMINFLAMIGWNPGDDREILSIDDLIKDFKIEKVQKGGAIFNVEKLNWINKEYLKLLDEKDIFENIKKELPELDDVILKKLTPVILERINKWNDIRNLKEEGEFDWILKDLDYPKEKLLWKEEKDFLVTKENIDKVVELLQKISSDKFNNESIKNAVWEYAEEKGRGNILWPMRYALSGRDRSPDPFTLASVLGKDETINRLTKASSKLNA